MSTKRKTSLYLVCFYALFLITSCVNSKKNKVTFQAQNKESQAEVSVLYRTETSLSIQLTCVSKAKGIDIKEVNLVCLNPNPIGNNVKVLDTADSKPVQVYNGEYNGNKIRVVLPYGNLEKTSRDLILNVVSASKANLELKLAKSKVVKQEA
ncbi:hypothetical protein [Pedobacter xixiisoli]|uniref:Lipoprotein n=1 Tax=Pedobacter xixiisoli TaxID=1476464 RepID=A0A286A0E2_9SPHI|nr:hypothetical protein [Pedobacter xixiisoli]SOD15373.1 hypothetical protein SAMN06297358_2365 [Pedobacter xixiisoli]